MSSGCFRWASRGPGAEGLPESIDSPENPAQTGRRLVGPRAPAADCWVRTLAAGTVSLLLACEALVIPVKTRVARSWCGAQLLS